MASARFDNKDFPGTSSEKLRSLLNRQSSGQPDWHDFVLLKLGPVDAHQVQELSSHLRHV